MFAVSIVVADIDSDVFASVVLSVVFGSSDHYGQLKKWTNFLLHKIRSRQSICFLGMSIQIQILKVHKSVALKLYNFQMIFLLIFGT